MLPNHINLSKLVLFSTLKQSIHLSTGTCFVHIMLICNYNDSTNWIPCHGRNGSMKQGLFFCTSVRPSISFIRIGPFVFVKC